MLTVFVSVQKNCHGALKLGTVFPVCNIFYLNESSFYNLFSNHQVTDFYNIVIQKRFAAAGVSKIHIVLHKLSKFHKVTLIVFQIYVVQH